MPRYGLQTEDIISKVFHSIKKISKYHRLKKRQNCSRFQECEKNLSLELF